MVRILTKITLICVLSKMKKLLSHLSLTLATLRVWLFASMTLFALVSKYTHISLLIFIMIVIPNDCLY